MNDALRYALSFGLLVGLISAIYHMGQQHGRWLERRRQAMRHRLSRADQERWGITTIHAFNTKIKKR